MLRHTLLLAGVIGLGWSGAYAQTSRSSEPPATTRGGTANTSTGQTTPIPGGSKSQGTTSLDKGVQQKDDAIPGQVCKGC